MTDLHKLKIEKHHKASRHERRIWPWLLLILLLAAAGIAVWQFQQHASVRKVEVLRVRLPEPASQIVGGGAASATQSDSDLVVLNATGYIMAAHKIELASKVIGRVAWVGVEMGDKVKKDQVLVRLEDDEFKARVAQQTGQVENARARLAELEAGNRPEEIASAQAQLDKAIAEADSADRTWKRLQDIRTRNNTSMNELEEAEASAKSKRATVNYQQHQLDLMKAGARKEEIAAQRATVSQLEAMLAQANIDLTNTVIRSPLDATILERNVEQGEFVTTGFVGDRGAKGYVVSIADLNDLLVDLDISQNDFAKVSDDGACWITTDAYPDKKYKGKVELISPVANRQKATIEVRIKVLTPDGLLKPDMNATVSFLAPPTATTHAGGTAQPAPLPNIRIPASAIRNNSVYIVENGRAIKRQVTHGMTTASGDIEIRKGLIGGEDLILTPPEGLQDNERVEVDTLPK